MTSPFLGVCDNATLWFQVETGQMVEDPETGNVSAEKKELKLRAYLKPSSRPGVSSKPGESSYPGTDEGEEKLEGYLVEPMQLPKGIRHLMKARAVISGKEGSLTLYYPVQSAVGANLATGDRIYGLFKQQV